MVNTTSIGGESDGVTAGPPPFSRPELGVGEGGALGVAVGAPHWPPGQQKPLASSTLLPQQWPLMSHTVPTQQRCVTSTTPGTQQLPVMSQEPWSQMPP